MSWNKYEEISHWNPSRVEFYKYPLFVDTYHFALAYQWAGLGVWQGSNWAPWTFDFHYSWADELRHRRANHNNPSIWGVDRHVLVDIHSYISKHWTALSSQNNPNSFRSTFYLIRQGLMSWLRLVRATWQTRCPNFSPKNRGRQQWLVSPLVHLWP